MSKKTSLGLLLGFVSTLFSGTAWALDEAVLTTTPERAIAGLSVAESQRERADAEKDFNAAMSVWLTHRYADGEKLLGEFAARHPNSRWRAEAELHQGCYLTYVGRSNEARPIFQRLAAEFADTNIRTKAMLRLGSIAEQDAKTDEAIAYYSQVLRANPTWDQFKYANYHARKLAMTRGGQEARINCGPVALAACLDAIGRSAEAAAARGTKPSSDGVSLGALEAQCVSHGIAARSVEMTLGELSETPLPILAYVEPKHFVAVLGIKDGKVQTEDSIRGKYEMTLDELGRIWSGKVLSLAPTAEMKPLATAVALETIGGCCGQIPDDECLGEPCQCQHTSSGGSDGCSPGRPTWSVNVENLNVLVRDTPIFYDPGIGPGVAFTLTYSNENSNTGIFGRGWRAPYDMKVFFLPSSYLAPTLQVHRDNGRIETYEWNSIASAYKPRSFMANYGYRDTIERQADGTVILSLRGGGKYYFMPEGGPAEGRIQHIEDQVQNRVTCGYDSNGCLSTVTDASGGVTNIITEGVGINERVRYIRIPKYVSGAWVQNDREAELRYTDGNLTHIRDMLGDASTLSYNAMLFYTEQASASTTMAKAISTTFPANGGAIPVASAVTFLSSGKVKINNDEEITYTGKTSTSLTGITRGATPKAASAGTPVIQVTPGATLSAAITETTPGNGESLGVNESIASFPDSGWIAIVDSGLNETLHYSGKSGNAFTGITRGSPAYAASQNAAVYLCSQSPYLSEIVTPSRKSKFTYQWDGNSKTGNFVTLHEVYECGPTESYPAEPTVHYEWTEYHTHETRYGDLTRTYDWLAGVADAANFTVDEVNNVIVQYGYNDKRDRTSITDASGNKTYYFYHQDKSEAFGDGEHDMYYRADPLGAEWAFTYYPNHKLHTEADAYGRTVRTYTYNAAGQLTQVDTPLGTQEINHYDAQGRLDYSADGRSKTTHYYYNENGDNRGFLTSVEDPGGKRTRYHYDERGRRDQITDANNNTTTYQFDDLDRVTRVTHTDNTYAESMYTCCHKVYDQDENGRRTYYVYDAKVRPYKTIASAKSTTLAAGITTTVPADNLAVASVADLPTSGKVVVLDEIISYTGIDAPNNLLTGITRGADGTRRVEVDLGFPVGRVDTVPATYGYHTKYLDWMISLTDALDHTTYYEYYLNGKSKTVRYPDNKGERYTYDNSNSGNNLIKKEYGTFTGTYPDQAFDPNNDLTVNYEYNVNNQLLRSYH